MNVSTEDYCRAYGGRLSDAFQRGPLGGVRELAEALFDASRTRVQVFLAGNGGSAANAMHLANDFLYGMAKSGGRGLRVEALPANPSVLTCLANDMSYEDVFAEQLRIKGTPGDLLLALSGSGNSQNIVRALERANAIGMRSFAILGYTGGRCRELAQVPIHFAVDDMQVAEDLQMIVGHICMQWVVQAQHRSSAEVTA